MRGVAAAGALALLASACAGSAGSPLTTAPPPGPETLPDPTTTRPTPPTTVAPVTAAPPGSDFQCTEVIGFSQTGSDHPGGGGWYTDGGFERLEGIDDGAWQLRWRSGAGVTQWLDPSFNGWDERRLSSPCTTGPVDRVVFHITDRIRGVDQWVASLEALVAALRDRFPDAERIDLVPIVGGPGGAVCPSPNGQGLVHASEVHPVIDEAIARVADGSSVVAGPSPELSDCAQYRDKPGHFTSEAAVEVAEQFRDFYAG